MSIPENSNIFVTNFLPAVELRTLLELFGEVGNVQGVQINYGDTPDQTFGCITMSTVEEAEKAMNKFNGYEFDGKLLSISKEEPIREKPKQPTIPRASSSSSRNVICVENLLEDRLAEMFSKHGKVEDVEIIFNARSGKSKAYIIMNNETDMNNAIADLNGHSLDVAATKLYVYPLRPKIER